MRAESETAGQVKKVSIFDIIQAQLLQKIEQALGYRGAFHVDKAVDACCRMPAAIIPQNVLFPQPSIIFS